MPTDELQPVKGIAEPRVYTPELRPLTRETSRGFEAIDFAENILGVTLRPWQRWLLIHGLEIDPETDEYRFDRIVVLVARQNGKTLLMIVLALWRMFVDGASEIISTAQNLDVAESSLDDGFRMAAQCEVLRPYLPNRPGVADPYDPYRGASMNRTNGKFRMDLARMPEGLESVLDVTGGLPSWRVQTATRKGGRSISADLALIDELREHYDWDAWNAITPTTISRPRAQVWAFSNAGDVRSVVLRSLRDNASRAIDLGQTADERLALFEWSAPDDMDIQDPEAWRMANPSLGYGAMTVQKLAGLARTPPEAGFKTEYLCQWVETLDPAKVDPDDWDACRVPDSTIPPGTRIAVGLDVSHGSSATHVVVAAELPDGNFHVEVVASRAGVHWVREWFEQRLHDPGSWFEGQVAIQGRGAPASALIDDLVDAGVDVVPWEGSHLARACGTFFNRLVEHRIQHLGQPVLDAAAAGSKDRKMADAWIWDREHSTGDVSPLVAGTAALWLLTQPAPKKFVSAYETADFIAI